MRAPFVLQQTGMALPTAALAALAAAGLYYVLAPAAKPTLSADDARKVEEHQVRHYLERKKQCQSSYAPFVPSSCPSLPLSCPPPRAGR